MVDIAFLELVKILSPQIEIIEAAGKILTYAGVGGLTTKNLAKEMGFSESAIYRHFSSKEAIIIALLQFLEENMDHRLADSASHNSLPVEKVREWSLDQGIDTAFVYIKSLLMAKKPNRRCFA